MFYFWLTPELHNGSGVFIWKNADQPALLKDVYATDKEKENRDSGRKQELILKSLS